LLALISISGWEASACAQTTAPSAGPIAFADGYLYDEQWSAGCGIDSLYIALELLKLNGDYLGLAHEAHVTQPDQWVDLNTLWDLARQHGATVQGLDFPTRSVGSLKTALSGAKRTVAVVHLRGVDGGPDHLVCMYVSPSGELKVAGGTGYQKTISATWDRRWSGVALMVSAAESPPAKSSDQVLSSTPRLFIAPGEIQAGPIAFGGTFHYRFKIHNGGALPLELQKVVASCSCNQFTLSDKVIAPGKDSLLDGTVSVGFKEGSNSGQIAILSNDPERPVAELPLSWSVLPPAAHFVPRNVKIEFKHSGEQVEQSIQVVANPDDLAHAKINVDARWVSAKIDAPASTLKLVLRPTGPSQLQTAEVAMTLASGEQMILPIEAVLKLPIQVQPETLFFSADSKSSISSQTVTLRPAAGTKPFKVIKAVLVGIDGKVDCTASQDGLSWTLRVTPLISDSRESLLKAAMKIETDEPDAKMLEIPVYIHSN
jgi:hypothetical protein